MDPIIVMMIKDMLMMMIYELGDGNRYEDDDVNDDASDEVDDGNDGDASGDDGGDDF